jgi:hypothetical protein
MVWLGRRTCTPLIKTPAGASIIVLLSVGLRSSLKKSAASSTSPLPLYNIILSDEVVVYSFLMTTRKAQRPTSCH